MAALYLKYILLTEGFVLIACVMHINVILYALSVAST